MEMMVVLLIVAIIAAASAPMVTKKLSRNTGTGDSPWVFTGLNNTIAYLGGGNGQVLIGAAQAPDDADNASLYIAGRNGWSHLRFGNEDGTRSMGITADPGSDNLGQNSRIGIASFQGINSFTNNSVIFGAGCSTRQNSTEATMLGTMTTTQSARTVTIGYDAMTEEDSTAAVAIGYRAEAAGNNSIAIGGGGNEPVNYTHTEGDESIAIGRHAYTLKEDHSGGDFSIAIGSQAHTKGPGVVAIGNSASAICNNVGEDPDGDDQDPGYSVAIGSNASTPGCTAVAIGKDAAATKVGAIAIGSYARAEGKYSIALGMSAKATADHQIVLGSTDGARDTVYIPGNLIVGGNVILNQDDTSATTSIRTKRGSWRHPVSVVRVLETRYPEGGIGLKTYGDGVYVSDRRLKNVGDKYAAGLAELKKLDFFHYTFKKDEEKTPHVGVIAQDLQKVFPDAVTKGEDGYLRIRWEDMFYAVINAVKELDNKIAEIVQNITEINSTIEKQNQTISEQAKIIEEQNTRLEELEELNGKQTKMLETQSRDIDNLIKRIEKLEAK